MCQAAQKVLVTETEHDSCFQEVSSYDGYRNASCNKSAQCTLRVGFLETEKGSLVLVPKRIHYSCWG